MFLVLIFVSCALSYKNKHTGGRNADVGHFHFSVQTKTNLTTKLDRRKLKSLILFLQPMKSMRCSCKVWKRLISLSKYHIINIFNSTTHTDPHLTLSGH